MVKSRKCRPRGYTAQRQRWRLRRRTQTTKISLPLQRRQRQRPQGPQRRRCEVCGATRGALLVCGACRGAVYCGVRCQALAWRCGHAFACASAAPLLGAGAAALEGATEVKRRRDAAGGDVYVDAMDDVDMTDDDDGGGTGYVGMVDDGDGNGTGDGEIASPEPKRRRARPVDVRRILKRRVSDSDADSDTGDDTDSDADGDYNDGYDSDYDSDYDDGGGVGDVRQRAAPVAIPVLSTVVSVRGLPLPNYDDGAVVALHDGNSASRRYMRDGRRARTTASALVNAVMPYGDGADDDGDVDDEDIFDPRNVAMRRGAAVHAALAASASSLPQGFPAAGGGDGDGDGGGIAAQQITIDDPAVAPFLAPNPFGGGGGGGDVAWRNLWRFMRSRLVPAGAVDVPGRWTLLRAMVPMVDVATLVAGDADLIVRSGGGGGGGALGGGIIVIDVTTRSRALPLPSLHRRRRPWRMARPPLGAFRNQPLVRAMMTAAVKALLVRRSGSADVAVRTAAAAVLELSANDATGVDGGYRLHGVPESYMTAAAALLAAFGAAAP